MSAQSSTIGKISLWSASMGIVAPIALALIGNLVNPAQRLSPESVVLYCALWVVLELIALACGIVVRRTATGKVGLVVSIISFALAGVVLVSI